LESEEVKQSFSALKTLVDELEKFLNEKLPGRDAHTPIPELAALTGEAIDRFNVLYELSGTLRAYLNSFVSTDSHNTLAMKKISEFQMTNVRVQMLGNQFQAWVGRIAPVLEQVIAFFLRETADQAKYLMPQAEESLAAELGLSGTNAWSKLQGTVTSQLTVDFELDGITERLPMPALINLHSHPEEAVRKRAYEAELEAWKSAREPLAACLNGVKGWSNTLNQKRGRRDALHQALDLARIDHETLEAMLGAMQASFLAFRRYYAAKAKRLGRKKLAWWDIFAPAGKAEKIFTFEEARDFIVTHFGSFSPELADFAARAFEHNWIDAEQREGKRGGAFCMGIPLVKESRVLCNFDGTLDQVSTVAHELGHGFHNHCAYQAGKTDLQKDTPMTMAETASIMCETIVMQAILKETKDPQEELGILETQLIGDAQVIVDIYSRFLFEKEVFERRAKSELSADELCEMMEKAQKETYGELATYHPYMWTWKPHYYYGGLPFYNFPYAFGLLFGTGLYAIYQERGADFIPDYKSLLASTGEATAADLAGRFGIEIRGRKFWEESLGVIARRIERYCEL
jgi:oligoendopeptidase F